MARVKDEALFSLLRDYLTIYLLNQRKSSPNTVKAYRSAWNQFLKYLAAENKVRIIEVSFEMKTRTLSAATLPGCPKRSRRQ